jgi:membrane-bound lytic murein transglycosylase A
MRWLGWPALCALAIASGCTTPPAQNTAGGKPTLGLAAVAFSALPGWAQDDPAQALPPFLASCARLSEMAPDQPLGGAGLAAKLGGTPAAWAPACTAAAGVPAGDWTAARRFFEQWFQPYAVSDATGGSAEGLFTGYYEPEVAGSRSPGPRYPEPLLGKPDDLVQVDLGQFAPDLKGRSIAGRVVGRGFVPYYDRAEIEAGALAPARLGLLWLADPVDAFFLQIQGSGRVRLPDGHVVRVSYAAQNGRPYVPLGWVLAQEGDIPLKQVSLQTIRAWLVAHPDQAAAMMDRNPSYVFFRELDGLPDDQGPPGALGAPLTPGRSIAVDRRFLPLGAPVFVATTDPVTLAPVRRLMQAQDVGGAIAGPVRADIFWGWGPDAEARAGLMKAPGTDYVLLPRGGATPAAS